MLSCRETESLVARYADGDSRLTGIVRAEIGAHVAGCAACRALLDEQRDVRRVLEAREPSRVPAGFASSVVARIERASRKGWLDLANWRGWTVGLVPLAAALLLVAYLDSGPVDTRGTATTSESASAGANQIASTALLDLWPPSPSGTPATVLMQPASSADLLLETVLTGAVPSTAAETPNVR